MEKILSLLKQFWALDPEEKVDILRRYQKYIYAFVLGLVTLEILLFGILPKWIDLSKQKKQLAQYESLLSEKKKKILNKNNVEMELAKLQENLRENESHLFTQDEFNAFSIHTVGQLAKKNGCKITSVIYKPVQNLNAVTVIYPLKLRVDGNYRSLNAFCTELETYEKIIKISLFSISKKTISPLQLSMDMDIEGYGAANEQTLP